MVSAAAAQTPVQPAAFTPVAPPRAWDRTTLELFASLPIQDEGRIKPLDTFARYQLIRISGRSTVRTASGDRRSALEWLLDCMFTPETANSYSLFIVENPDVMQLAGLPTDRARRRFSYNEIQPVESHLLHLAQTYSEIPEKERTLVQGQILNFNSNLYYYREILHALDFARYRARVAPDHPLASLFPTPEDGVFSIVLAQLPRIIPLAMQSPPTSATTAVSQFLNELGIGAGMSTILAVLPPLDPARQEWYSPGKMLEQAFDGQMPPADQIRMLARFASVVRQAGQPEAFLGSLRAFRDETAALARSRDEARHVGLEVFLNRARIISNAHYLYILGFLLAAFMWLLPRNRRLPHATAGSVIGATVLLTAGMTIRCIINGRPPVTNLYDTTLFVPAAAALVALGIEWMMRNRIALSMAAAIGAVGLFISNRYEMRGNGDTISSLVAVLDSNFWLSTHVITVTIGYSAGLLAAALAHLYVFGRAFGLSRRPEFFKDVTRMVYGIVCFGLFFSFVGTVLGGIWANYSWGRFWGWDPKENGALLIVLANLIILHARLGGYIRDLGLSLAAIATGMVVAFSWWGVNLLGVGLHAYGFTEGIWQALMIFWFLECVVILLGSTLAYNAERRIEADHQPPPPPPGPSRKVRRRAEANT